MFGSNLLSILMNPLALYNGQGQCENYLLYCLLDEGCTHRN